MKMTIVTDGAGKVIGAVQGHSLTEHKDGYEATVSFKPDHRLHFVDVDDNMATVTDPVEYVTRLQSCLRA